MQELSKLDVEVVGVSGDEPAGLQLFRKANELNFTLLADTDGSVAKLFGVPLGKGGEITKEIDGETHVLKRGVTPGRWTFIVNKERKIAKVNPKVNASKDSDEVLEFVKKLQ